MNRILRLAAAGALVFAGACGRASREPAPAAAAPAAPAPLLVARFRPPADGRITAEQLDRYLRVRRAARGRSDRETARALGMDPDEFFWVRGRIVEASVELQSERVRAAAEATYARTLASLRESRRNAKDPAVARAIDEQIGGMERERGSIRKPDAVPASVTANARLIAARRAEIESVSP